eukprot:4387018-Pyramimonas_sp.AAC.1
MGGFSHVVRTLSYAGRIPGTNDTFHELQDSIYCHRFQQVPSQKSCNILTVMLVSVGQSFVRGCSPARRAVNPETTMTPRGPPRHPRQNNYPGEGPNHMQL